MSATLTDPLAGKRERERIEAAAQAQRARSAHTLAGLVRTAGVGWHSPPDPRAAKLQPWAPVARERRMGTCPAFIATRPS